MKPITVAILLSAFLFLGLVLPVVCLWIAGQFCGTPRPAFRGACRAGVPIFLGILIASLVLVGAGFSSSRAALAGVCLAAISAVSIHRSLGITKMRTAKILLFTLLLVASGAYGSLAALRFAAKEALLLESYEFPTGSMAPTLFGRALIVTCADCGRGSRLGLTTTEDGDLAPALRECAGKLARLTCPFCGGQYLPVEDPQSAPADHFLVDLTANPGRWDLACFRFPPKPSTMYLKRLVGLPGERIEIVDGEVFVGGRILRKPPDGILDLWFPVHDTAGAVSGSSTKCDGWWPQSAPSHWKSGPEGGWSFEDSDDPEEAIASRWDVTNAEAYNSLFNLQFPVPPPRPVGDVRIACTLGRFEGAGSLVLLREQGGATVRGIWTAAGSIALEAGSRRAVASLPQPLASGATIALAVRDGEASLHLDGVAILRLEVDAPDLETFRKGSPARSQPCRLRIAARGCKLSLRRVTIARDIYYLPARLRDPAAQGTSFDLGPDDFLMLGDNSEGSYDSRYWGAVPRANLKGVVRWLFWPPERARAFR